MFVDGNNACASPSDAAQEPPGLTANAVPLALAQLPPAADAGITAPRAHELRGSAGSNEGSSPDAQPEPPAALAQVQQPPARQSAPAGPPPAAALPHAVWQAAQQRASAPVQRPAGLTIPQRVSPEGPRAPAPSPASPLYAGAAAALGVGATAAQRPSSPSPLMAPAAFASNAQQQHSTRAATPSTDHDSADENTANDTAHSAAAPVLNAAPDEATQHEVQPLATTAPALAQEQHRQAVPAAAAQPAVTAVMKMHGSNADAANDENQDCENVSAARDASIFADVAKCDSTHVYSTCCPVCRAVLQVSLPNASRTWTVHNATCNVLRTRDLEHQM